MDHKDFIGAVAASMAMSSSAANNTPSPKDLEEERVDEIRSQSNDANDEVFKINIPMISGRVFGVDARQVDWNSLGTPESQTNLEQNEGTIRAMVHQLVTADFTDPETDQMIKDFDESIMNLFHNFGIDPGYEELEKQTMVRPYVLLLGKCFDALTLINVIAHNVAMHGLASQIFGITDQFKEVADLNDITEMDNSVEGLISDDRHAFDGVPDKHDVSGLLGD